MNAKQAKHIPLEEILHDLGYEPTRENRDELVYLSPFREEKVPSFFLNTAKNVWHDFGRGEGGNVIDFIMTYYDIPSVSTALIQLDQLCGPQERKIGLEKSPPQEAKEAGSSQSLHLLKIQSLQNKALLQYLKQRGICWQTASPYLKEIYYSLKQDNRAKRYFALAFPNLSGGYELRNPYFKGCLGKKDISLLAKRKGRGEEQPTKAEAVTVFEGFMDFLSALCFYQVAEAKTQVIVLNSVSLKERAIEQIRANRFTKVYLYLDRDNAGNLLLAHFRKQLSSNIALIDQSDLYSGYKDFNEFFVSTTVP